MRSDGFSIVAQSDVEGRFPVPSNCPREISRRVHAERKHPLSISVSNLVN